MLPVKFRDVKRYFGKDKSIFLQKKFKTAENIKCPRFKIVIMLAQGNKRDNTSLQFFVYVNILFKVLNLIIMIDRKTIINDMSAV